MALSRSQQEKLAKGWAHFQAGQLDQAFAAFDTVRRAAPRDAQTLKLLGLVAMQRKEPAKAVALFEGALAGLPDDVSTLNNIGNALRDLKRPADALPYLDRALAMTQTVADLHNNRGNILLDLRRLGEAKLGFDRAIALRPAYAEAFLNRGTALAGLGDKSGALAEYDRAVGLQPGYAKAHAARGRVLLGLRRRTEALAAFMRASGIEPDNAESHLLCGIALNGLCRPEDALMALDKALALQPDDFEALQERGNALNELSRQEEALASYDHAIRIRADDPVLYSNRANPLIGLKRDEEALASVDHALALAPRLPEAHCTRATVLRALGRIDEAVACYRTTVEIKPDFADAWYNFGVLELDRQEFAKAQSYFDRAIGIDPDHVGARFNLSIVRLLQGDLIDGFKLYEWRKRLPNVRWKLKLPAPVWSGESDLRDQHVFMHWEQGFGDTIQFVRYALLAREAGAKVTLGVQGALGDLIDSLHPDITVLRDEATPAKLDFQCALLSLPMAFGTRLDTIPATPSYLSTDPARVAAWRARLGPRKLRRIGLAWSGNAQHHNDRNRSFTLADFAPILACDADFIVVQKELRADDAATMGSYPGLRHFPDHQGDFADTAALIGELDVLISVDTSVAHLAGAIAAPVWVLLPHNPDFRWMLGRDDTPWYPSMRLFRPASPDARAEQVARVADALRAFIAP